VTSADSRGQESILRLQRSALEADDSVLLSWTTGQRRAVRRMPRRRSSKTVAPHTRASRSWSISCRTTYA
jgi:hypothetical protein